MKNRDKYYSHIGQDAWVAQCFNHTTDGFFLDFGAFDGTTISNTYMLEKELKWTGICVEPNPLYYKQLCSTRTAACINRALWHKSLKKMKFLDAHGLSSFDKFKTNDVGFERRLKATRKIIEVDTLNPTSLLERFEAPEYIHYLSLDVEGAEYEIIKAVDLKSYKIALMTIEHNHNKEKQKKIRKYLEKFGYEAIQHRNDDFFINHDHLAKLRGEGEYLSPNKIAADILENYEMREG